MPDEVTGIAVLDVRLCDDGAQRLAVWCTPAGRPRFRSVIPVYPANEPKPARFANSWAYRIEGDVLHLTPSLHCLSGRGPNGSMVTDFHNGFNWSTKFILFATVESEVLAHMEAHPDEREYGQSWEMHIAHSEASRRFDG